MGELREPVALRMSGLWACVFLGGRAWRCATDMALFSPPSGQGLGFSALSFFGVSGTVMAQVHDTSPGICSVDDFIMIVL